MSGWSHAEPPQLWESMALNPELASELWASNEASWLPHLCGPQGQGIRAGCIQGFNLRAEDMTLCNKHQTQDFMPRL